MPTKPPVPKRGIAELIIATQSALLALVGLAGMMAVTPVLQGFNALRDRDSAVAIVTDKGITTDKTEVDLTQVFSIIQNYRSVCLVAMCLGGMVFIATLIRIYQKRNEIITTTSRAPRSMPKRPSKPRTSKSRG
jgi:hypothetical protein